MFQRKSCAGFPVNMPGNLCGEINGVCLGGKMEGEGKLSVRFQYMYGNKTVETLAMQVFCSRPHVFFLNPARRVERLIPRIAAVRE